MRRAEEGGGPDDQTTGLTIDASFPVALVAWEPCLTDGGSGAEQRLAYAVPVPNTAPVTAGFEETGAGEAPLWLRCSVVVKTAAEGTFGYEPLAAAGA